MFVDVKTPNGMRRTYKFGIIDLLVEFDKVREAEYKYK